MSSPGFKVLFEDTHLVVLDKPAGLLSQGGDLGGRQGGAPEPNLVDLLRVYFGRNYVGLIHRLDRNTSGLMTLMATSRWANGSQACHTVLVAPSPRRPRTSYLPILSGVSASMTKNS